VGAAFRPRLTALTNHGGAETSKTEGTANCANWVGAFDEAAVAEIVGAPPHARPVAILPVGYAAEKPESAGRRTLEDLVLAERFRG
jgi:hypothetical protein